MTLPDTAARIASVETFVATYPVTGQFKFFTQPARGTVLVKITSESGHVGWGQSVPSPTWSYETLDSARTTIDRYLAPALRGMDAFATDAIWRTMNRAIALSYARRCSSPGTRRKCRRASDSESKWTNAA